jgi:hypothetical protein
MSLIYSRLILKAFDYFKRNYNERKRFQKLMDDLAHVKDVTFLVPDQDFII